MQYTLYDIHYLLLESEIEIKYFFDDSEICERTR